jgi:hypothetical protein
MRTQVETAAHGASIVSQLGETTVVEEDVVVTTVSIASVGGILGVERTMDGLSCFRHQCLQVLFY